MSDKNKESLNFGFKAIIRLVVFFIIVFFLISYLQKNIKLQQSKNDPTVLGQQSQQDSQFFKNLYQSIPLESRQKLENINQFEPYLYLERQYHFLLDQANGFPQKQINQLKKDIIQSIYQDLMNNIDEN